MVYDDAPRNCDTHDPLFSQPTRPRHIICFIALNQPRPVVQANQVILILTFVTAPSGKLPRVESVRLASLAQSITSELRIAPRLLLTSTWMTSFWARTIKNPTALRGIRPLSS